MTNAALNAAEHGAIRCPPRSKMIDMYTADVARMVADGRERAAERAALAIPHIAVALAHAQLQSSRRAYQDWCTSWVSSQFVADLYEDWSIRSAQCEGGEEVPVASLRQLRLLRRAREVSLPLLAPETTGVPTPQAVAYALLRAARRWYEQEGRYQPTVQTNLARLGVLR
jgi:hypothetical protein